MKWKLLAWLSVACTVWSFVVTVDAAKPKVEPEPAVRSPEIQRQVDRRLQWFKHDKFGMFIHWGIWSNPAGMYKGKPHRHFTEWHQHRTGQEWRAYSQLAKQFNPTKFDADYWMQMAKRAGMKYVVITTKHHDGFAIFPSEHSTYDIDDASPFDRDPLKELQAACRKHGIRLGFYYSHCVDWSHPGGYKGGAKLARSRKHDKSLDWDHDGDIDHEDYVKGKSLPQVRELLSNYGDVAVMWFDIARFGVEYPTLFHDMIRELQPQCLINSRIVEGSDGIPDHPDLYDYYSMGDYETHAPKGGMYWESTISMHGSYGVDHRPGAENRWRTTERLLRQLVTCVAHDGNYLLNIGPEGDGSLNRNTIDRLEAIGRWMDANSDSIYGTTANPFTGGIGLAGQVTVKGERLFVHLFNWPRNGTATLTLNGLNRTITSATILNGGAAVDVGQSGDKVTLSGLPADDQRPDKVGHSVLVLTLDKPM